MCRPLSHRLSIFPRQLTHFEKGKTTLRQADITNNLFFMLHYPSQKFGLFRFVLGFRGLFFYFLCISEKPSQQSQEKNGRVQTVRMKQDPGERGMGGGFGRTPGGRVRGPRRFPSAFQPAPAAVGQGDREKTSSASLKPQPSIPVEKGKTKNHLRTKPLILL